MHVCIARVLRFVAWHSQRKKEKHRQQFIWQTLNCIRCTVKCVKYIYSEYGTTCVMWHIRVDICRQSNKRCTVGVNTPRWPCQPIFRSCPEPTNRYKRMRFVCFRVLLLYFVFVFFLVRSFWRFLPSKRGGVMLRLFACVLITLFMLSLFQFIPFSLHLSFGVCERTRAFGDTNSDNRQMCV